MAKVKITNMVKFYSMLLLFEKPMHGYEIIKEVGNRLEKKVSPGEIYPFLSKLEKNKLIKSEKIKERDKKTYHLTKEGRVFVKKMLSKFGGLIDIAVEPRLTVCAHCGCKIYEGGYEEKIKGRNLKFCCHHCAMSFKKEK